VFKVPPEEGLFMKRFTAGLVFLASALAAGFIARSSRADEILCCSNTSGATCTWATPTNVVGINNCPPPPSGGWMIAVRTSGQSGTPTVTSVRSPPFRGLCMIERGYEKQGQSSIDLSGAYPPDECALVTAPGVTQTGPVEINVDPTLIVHSPWYFESCWAKGSACLAGSVDLGGYCCQTVQLVVPNQTSVGGQLVNYPSIGNSVAPAPDIAPLPDGATAMGMLKKGVKYASFGGGAGLLGLALLWRKRRLHDPA
jgi:hypothetical protein